MAEPSAPASAPWRPGLVATDLDGTLLRPDGSLSAASRRVLAAVDAAGVPVVLVTARPRRWMGGLWPVVGAHGLAVLSNGALTWDVATHEPLELRPFEAAVGRRVAERLGAALPGVGVGAERVSGLVCDAAYREHEDPPAGRVVEDREEWWDEPVLKLLVQDHAGSAERGPERFREAVTALVGDDAVATWTLPGLVEISANGVTKGAALARVAERLDVPAVQVVAFGDMPNDLPMLAWAGRGYAVANAHEEVLGAADAVVGSCGHDGVAQALVDLLGLPSGLMSPC